ncbi:hypothetical protein QFC21_001090 [Naganishia friedmannii]|uniref:Uncharacterized protein n=1 Tax=Naganishia friedmannii TaxID=89922 RepID=A0ACC2W8J9_9TREE|nr:hypothetical protein QFC21_001090 [Naganishia friedmannii]
MTRHLPANYPLHCRGYLPKDAYLNNPNSISIYRTSDLIFFVRPPNPDADLDDGLEKEPNDDCILTGVVIVHLTQPRRVQALRVRFVTLCRLAFPNKAVEDDVLFETQVSIQNDVDPSEGFIIEPGPQRFEFSLVLPAHIAPFNRTPAGAVWHKMEATLVGYRTDDSSGAGEEASSHWLGGRLNKANRSSSPTGKSRATSPITSLFGRSSSPTFGNNALASPGPTSPSREPYPQQNDVVTADDTKWLNMNMTASKEIWIIALPTPDKTALPLAQTHQSFIQGLGIIPWSLQTDAITVSGYLLLKFGLLTTHVNPKSTIWGVRLYIEQQVSIKSPRRPDEPASSFPPTRMLMYELGSVPAQVDLDSGHYSLKPLWTGHQVPGYKTGGDDSLNVAEVLRLPDEEKLRPTSYAGSVTPVRVEHWFGLSIYFSVWDEDVRGNALYRNQNGQLRDGKLRIKTAIAHCSCTVKNLSLPPYQPHETSLAIKDEGQCDMCACGQPLDQLMERELDRGDDVEAFDELGVRDSRRDADEAGRDGRKGRGRAPVVKS